MMNLTCCPIENINRWPLIKFLITRNVAFDFGGDLHKHQDFLKRTLSESVCFDISEKCTEPVTGSVNFRFLQIFTFYLPAAQLHIFTPKQITSLLEFNLAICVSVVTITTHTEK